MGLASKTGSMPMDRRRLLLPAACVLLAGFLIRPAAADQYDALNVVLGGSITHDANLLRVPGFANPQSDTITTGYVGLRIDKPYAQQRFQLDVTETAYRYNKFSDLNFDALEYRGAWLWHLSPRLSGTLSAQRKQSLVPFEDFRGFQRNLRTTDYRNFNLDGWAFGGWHLLLGVSDYEQKNSLPFLTEGDYRATTGEAGLKYVAASGSSISFVQRLRQGDYLNRAIIPATFIDNAFRDDESELRATWTLSGHAAFNGRLTRRERRHENFAQRDFSGTMGELVYAWTPTGKLRLDFSAKRDISSWWEPFASYRVNDTLSFAPTWQVSAKAAVRVRLDRIHSDFRGPVVVPAGPLRSDTVNSAQLAADWSPTRTVTLTASLQRLRRSSNTPGLDFDTTVASFNAALMF